MNLVLIRGLPGSGKSTIAKHMSGHIHLEADMYHMKDGEYCFDPAKVKDAHTWCQQQTKNLIAAGDSVVVSNTFTRLWEMQPYFEMAKEFGIEPNVIEAKGNWKNQHNVPDSVLEAMRNRWEEMK